MPTPNPATGPADEIVEFQKLFWAARRAHSKTRGSASHDDPAHLAALRYAEARGWQWAKGLLTALLKIYQNGDIDALNAAQQTTVPAPLAGERLFLLGIAHYRLSQWSEAIGCYQRALASDAFAGRGYNGLIRLVRETKPRLTLVGEFWAGLADLRLDLIAGIRLRSGVPAVLPACLGLRLRLLDFTVRCTRSGKQVPASAVKVAPPLREFGELGYLSPDSIL